jgi:hypothetical protein
VHQFDASEGGLRVIERLKAHHRPHDPLDSAMILFHDVIEIFNLTDFNQRAMLLVVALDRRFVGRATVNLDLLGYATVAANRLIRNCLATFSSRCSVRRKSIVLRVR